MRSVDTSRCRRQLSICLMTLAVPLAGCDSGASGSGEPAGERVHLVLSEGTPAPPALVEGRCVVFTERPSDEELQDFMAGRVPAIFGHVGASVRQCMKNRAESYLGELPEAVFFDRVLYVNLDGECPPDSAGCYYPANPTVDQAQFALVRSPATAEQQLDMLVGHEIWHAVAGNFHIGSG